MQVQFVCSDNCSRVLVRSIMVFSTPSKFSTYSLIASDDSLLKCLLKETLLFLSYSLSPKLLFRPKSKMLRRTKNKSTHSLVELPGLLHSLKVVLQARAKLVDVRLTFLLVRFHLSVESLLGVDDEVVRLFAADAGRFFDLLHLCGDGCHLAGFKALWAVGEFVMG